MKLEKQSELVALMDQDGNINSTKSITCNFNIDIKGDIKCLSLKCRDLKCRDIKTYISVSALDIKCRNIDSYTVYAASIIAKDISYGPFCIAHEKLVCTSIKSRYKKPYPSEEINGVHKCLDQDIEILK